MTDNVIFALTLISALGSGLIAGAFFAFSSFVMKALARLPPAQGIAAMQSIDVVVINPWFMTAFLGTAATCVFLAIAALLRWQRPGAAYLLFGSLLYLAGTFMVTMLFNVPLNNSLAAVAPESAEGATLWTTYLISWTNWNHVRTAAGLVAMALLIIGLCAPRACHPAPHVQTTRSESGGDSISWIKSPKRIDLLVQLVPSSGHKPDLLSRATIRTYWSWYEALYCRLAAAAATASISPSTSILSS